MNIKAPSIVLPLSILLALLAAAAPQRPALAQCGYDLQTKQPLPCEKEKKARPTAIPPTATFTPTATATNTPKPTATSTKPPTPTDTSTPVPPVASGGGDKPPASGSSNPLPVGLFYLGVLGVAGLFIYLRSRLLGLQKDPTPAWSSHKKAASDEPTLEFTSANPKSLNAELMFDMFEDRGLAPDPAGNPALHDLNAAVRTDLNPDAIPDPNRDDAANVKYTLFLPDGTPTRATAKVAMKQPTKSPSKTTSKTSDDSSSSDTNSDSSSDS